jgi:hypothetical protein
MKAAGPFLCIKKICCGRQLHCHHTTNSGHFMVDILLTRATKGHGLQSEVTTALLTIPGWAGQAASWCPHRESVSQWYDILNHTYQRRQHPLYPAQSTFHSPGCQLCCSSYRPSCVSASKHHIQCKYQPITQSHIRSLTRL